MTVTEATAPPPPAAPRRPGGLRRTVRWCRRLLLLGLLLLGYAFVYVNQVGLPDFVKRPLLAQLQARGLNMDFSRLRVRLGRGLIAENVTLERLGEHAGEQFYANEVQLKLGWAPLARFQAPEIQSLRLRQGQITIPIPTGPGELPFKFSVTDVTGLVVFLGPEEWELRSLEATSYGGRFHAFGNVTNASVMRRPRARPLSRSDAWKRPLLQIGRTLERTRFIRPPEVKVAFHTDLSRPEHTTADLEIRAAGARWDGQEFRDLTLTAQFNQPPGTNDSLPATLRVEAAEAITRWGAMTEFTLDATGEISATNALPGQLEWSVRAQRLRSRRATADVLRMQGRTVIAGPSSVYESGVTISGQRVSTTVTNGLVNAGELILQANGRHSLSEWLGGTGTVHITDLASPWGSAGTADLEVSSSTHTGTNRVALDIPGGLGRWLGDWDLAAKVQVTNLTVHIPARDLDVPAHHLMGNLRWDGDQLAIEDLTTQTPAGGVQVRGDVVASTRRATAEFAGALDLHAYTALLTPMARQWLHQYGWGSNQPPQVAGSVGVTLPAWTNRQPDWRAEVLPTLTLAGQVAGTNFTFRGIPGDTARGTFAYTNRTWDVGEMTATRPEGALTFSYHGSEVTHEYHFRFHSRLDPFAAKPLLTNDRVQHVLGELQLTSTPEISGDVWGVWREPERTACDVQVAATNLVFRNEAIEQVSGRVRYTNRWLNFADVDVQAQGRAHVPGASYRFDPPLLSFTNATTTGLAPQRVARVIGPQANRVMTNYVFPAGPSTTLDGHISWGTNRNATDLRVRAQAPEFRWWRLYLTNASADLHFRGQTLALTGLRTDLHGGGAQADLYFDWSPDPGVLLRGDVIVTNVNLAGVVHTLISPTNRLEGVLSGQTRFNGNTANTNSWQGTGDVSMRDGYLWDVPLFGIFSKLFDALSPGAGQTRFNQGAMSFTVTNSVLQTRNLEVRSPAMRLNYRGTLDVGTRLDARMEAEMFRDTPLIGPLLNLALMPFTKLFVYDVKGTLKKPKADPRYVPKLLLAPLRPFKTLRELLPDDEAVPPASTSPPTPPKGEVK